MNVGVKKLWGTAGIRLWKCLITFHLSWYSTYWSSINELTWITPWPDLWCMFSSAIPSLTIFKKHPVSMDFLLPAIAQMDPGKKNSWITSFLILHWILTSYWLFLSSSMSLSHSSSWTCNIFDRNHLLSNFLQSINNFRKVNMSNIFLCTSCTKRIVGAVWIGESRLDRITLELLVPLGICILFDSSFCDSKLCCIIYLV